jgi:hypothetical protein
VKVVRHQTVRPNFQVIFPAVADKGIAVELTIFVIEEDVAAVFSALRYVVRVFNGYRSSNAWHGWMISYLSITKRRQNLK